MAGSGISNGEVGGKFSTGDIFGKTEVDMEASACINIFCRNSRVVGKAGSIGNNIDMEKML